jgi:hypothetical protein
MDKSGPDFPVQLLRTFLVMFLWGADVKTLSGLTA